MSEAEDKRTFCWAGRWAFNNGRWKKPCLTPPIHEIGAPGLEQPICLCDLHFRQVHAQGLVTQPNIGRERMERLMVSPCQACGGSGEQRQTLRLVVGGSAEPPPCKFCGGLGSLG